MTTTRIAILILLCALALPATAQVYRWVDKDGKVHYTGDKPPADVQAEVLPIKSANSLGGNASDEPAPAAAAAAAPTDPNDPNAALAKEVQALNQQRCSAAKAIAARYDSAPFLETPYADGSKTRLTPEAEAAERARMKRQVASACGGG